MYKEDKTLLTIIALALFAFLIVQGVFLHKVSKCNGNESYSYSSQFGVRFNRVTIESDPRCVIANTGTNQNFNIKGVK